MSANTDDPAPSPAYRSALSAASRRIYDQTSGDPDLTDEIRLLRTLITQLSKAPVRHAVAITRLLAILARACYIQRRIAGNTSQLESELMEAADTVLALDFSHLDPPDEMAS